MARITSSSNRSKRSTKKPVTRGQNPQRANRQAVSQAKVSSSANRQVTGSAKVTQGRGGSSMKADAQQWQKLNQSASARAGKAAERASRTPAPGTGNVVRTAIERGRAAAAQKGAQGAMRNMAGSLARARFARGPASAAAAVIADRTLGPLATKAGQKLGTALKNAMTKKRSEKAGPAAPARITKAPKAPKLPSANESTATAFDRAFKSARQAGKKEFTWRGKRYTTKMK